MKNENWEMGKILIGHVIELGQGKRQLKSIYWKVLIINAIC
jgi:hypothetical protein